MTATVVSFCGVMQPLFETPLWPTTSPLIRSTFVVGAYGFAVLNSDDRHSPTAVGDGWSRTSSLPPCAQGALIVGANFHFEPATDAAAPVRPAANMIPPPTPASRSRTPHWRLLRPLH